MYLDIQIYTTRSQMFINTEESENTRNWFRYENFYYIFEFKVFRHEERERERISSTNEWHISWTPTGLASRGPKINLPRLSPKLNELLFFKSPKSSALPGMTSFTSSVPFPIRGFYCDISDSHIRPARAWTPALNVCT